MSTSAPGNGAYAEFDDDEAARRAVQELKATGIPPSRILVGGQAPDQSATPIATQERDKRIVSRLWNLGTRGAVLGFIGGGIFGALLGALVWTPMTPAWILLAVGMAVFGTGLGLLWSLMIGKGEGTHMGTVYDEPAANKPTTITVRADDPKILERSLEMLESAGGNNLRRVPEVADRPDR